MTFSSAKIREEDSGEGQRAEKMDMEWMQGWAGGWMWVGLDLKTDRGMDMEQTWGWHRDGCGEEHGDGHRADMGMDMDMEWIWGWTGHGHGVDMR